MAYTTVRGRVCRREGGEARLRSLRSRHDPYIYKQVRASTQVTGDHIAGQVTKGSCRLMYVATIGSSVDLSLVGTRPAGQGAFSRSASHDRL